MDILGYDLTVKKKDGKQKPDAKEAAATRISSYEKQIKCAADHFEKTWWPKAYRMIKFYELDHYFDPFLKDIPVVDYDRIKVAYPYANARQVLAEIYAQNPDPIVRPGKMSVPEAASLLSGEPDPGFTPLLQTQDANGQPVQVDLKEGARTLKACINHCVRKSALKRNAELMVLDGVVTGLGVLQFSSQAKSKIPKYTRVTYRDIIYLETVNNPYDSPWVVRRWVRPIKDVKTDPRYDETVRSQVKATVAYDKTGTGVADPMHSKAEYVVIWAWWNKQDDEHCEWADGTHEFLLDKPMSEEYLFQIEEDDFDMDWPFIFFVNEDMLTEPTGMGDLLPIESQVRELDKTRTQQINHRKRFNRKYLVHEKFLDEAGMLQLKNGEDGTIVKSKTEITPGQFQVIPDATLSPDSYRIDETIQRDIQIIQPIGPNSLTRGVGKQPDTLGQAQLIEQNSAPRMSEKLDKVADVFSRIFRYTGQYIQQTWVETDVIRVTGDGSKATDWLHYTPDKVKGEYDYDVDPQTLRDNTVVFRRQAGEAISLVAPLLLQLYPKGVPALIRKYLETFDWKDINDIIPEDLAQMAPPTAPGGSPLPPEADPAAAGGAPPAAPTTPQGELIALIQSTPPQQFVDIVKNLPDNERQMIMQAIQNLQAQPAAQ